MGFDHIQEFHDQIDVDTIYEDKIDCIYNKNTIYFTCLIIETKLILIKGII